MDTSTPPPARAKHRLTWFVVLLGLLEIAAIVAFIEVKGFASTVCSATVAVQGLGTAAPAPVVGGSLPGGGDATAEPSLPAQPSPVPQSAQPQPVDSGAAGAAPASQNRDTSVHGDTKQVVDPKCVGNAAADALSSDSPAPGPTCGPMKQPAELQKAEQQISK